MAVGWTVEDVRDAVLRGEVSAVEVCQACLDRIAACNDGLNAFTTVTGERGTRARSGN